MAKIKLLPDHLITQIAAGEVIERPASILKELLENSLDAGATKISIEIEGAGRKRIVVSDNGCGMTAEDAEMALKRHATSKISKLEDLEAIDTFGFRGEALPSIAAVSRFTCTSRSATQEAGWRFRYENGIRVDSRPQARERGTTIEVCDLFYNTPARFKFLKADSTERNHCLRMVEDVLMAHLDVHFECKIENSKPTVYQASQSLPDRLAKVWGQRFSDIWNEVQTDTKHFQLHGVVTDAHHSQATPRHQLLYINNRPVSNRRLTRAVYEAFRGSLPIARHPAWVLFLNVDPKSIDVNVHPTKKEVKLTHESELFGFVLQAIRSAIQNDQSSEWVHQPTAAPPPAFSFAPQARSNPQAGAKEISTLMTEVYPPLQAKSGFEPLVPASSIKNKKFKAVGQIQNLFILAEADDSFYILDQHAAAERIRYEQLLANAKSTSPHVQMMLVPFTWEVAMSLSSGVEAYVKSFQEMGFLIEPFGDHTFVVKGYPSQLGEKFPLHDLLDGISDFLSISPKSKANLEDFQHELAAMAACKSTVKAGDALDIKECQALVDQLPQCDSPMTCPHGRPTFIRLAYQELKNRFRRP